MKIELLDKNCKPKYAHAGDACMDVFASRECEWSYQDGIYTSIVPLGFKVEVPREYVLMFFSRSGMGFKENISLINSVGIIDPFFSQECMVKLIKYNSNIVPEPIKKGQRVAQMLLQHNPPIFLEEVDRIEETSRGKGFGSSGKWEKRRKKMKPEQYQINIDTFERSKANQTAEDRLAIAKFMIDKYCWREKGQDKEDFLKIKDYCDFAIQAIEIIQFLKKVRSK